jgi:hypothetical protein
MRRMSNSRQLLYVVVGAAIVVTVAFGPRHIGRMFRDAHRRFAAGRHSQGPSPQEIFTRQHAAFDALARDIEGCKGSGLLSIYADGRIMGTASDSIACGDPAAIGRRLAPLGVDWVNIDGRSTGHYSMTFVLRADGDDMRASRSSFDYDPDAQADTTGSRRLDSAGLWQFTRGH